MDLAQEICGHDFNTIRTLQEASARVPRICCEMDTDGKLLHRKRLLQLAQVLGITKHVLRKAYREVFERTPKCITEELIALNHQKTGLQGKNMFIEEFVKGLDFLESV